MQMTLAEAASLASTSEKLGEPEGENMGNSSPPRVTWSYNQHRADYIHLCMEAGLMLTMDEDQSAPLLMEVNFVIFNDDPIFTHFSSLHGPVLFLLLISGITETLSG